MKTAVVQSFRAKTTPPTIRRCIDSVEAWAALKGFDYFFADDSSLASHGADLLTRVRRRVRAITNLSRLELAKDALKRGYDRVIWIDADVLVFHPELFTIDVVEGHAFARETWVTPQGDRWRPRSNVNASTFVCVHGEPDLDIRFHLILMRLTRHLGAHTNIERLLQIGDYLISGRHHSLAFETLDNVGRFSNHVVLALAHNRDDAVATQAIKHATPVFAAGLRASDRDTPPVSEREAETAIERLLESKGDIVNRWLLQSPNNLLRSPNPGMAALFPHEVLVGLQFKQKHGYEPDLANPRTYNERITAKKLTLTDDIYRITADKFAVRKFVEERVGRDVLIPLLQVCDRAEDLDFDALPTAFILKPTHGSGWKKIVRDKATIDRDFIRSTMRKWLRSNYFNTGFEVHYRDIPPRIVAERLLLTGEGEVPEDYRFSVFNGRVRIISAGQHSGTPDARITRFDPSWRRLLVQARRPAADDVPRPKRLPEMIAVAEELARDFDFARVDLYCFEDKVFFGEMTHTPVAGLTVFKPADFDAALGRIWESGEPIPEKYYARQSSSSDNSGILSHRLRPFRGTQKWLLNRASRESLRDALKEWIKDTVS